MKVSETDILIIPGHQNSGPGHWQSRWQARLSTARRVEQADWFDPIRDDWVRTIAEAVNEAKRPVVLVAHSLGVAAAVRAVPLTGMRIAGAFLVAPPDLDRAAHLPASVRAFGPYPREPLPFPSIVVGSQDDPFGTYEHAGDLANAWGSMIVDAGNTGHINQESGHGPWPEGTMVFAQFLSRLTPRHLH